MNEKDRERVEDRNKTGRLVKESLREKERDGVIFLSSFPKALM